MGRWTHFDSYFCEGVGSTTKQFSTNHLRWRARTTIRRWTTTRVSPSLLRFLGKKASTIPISPKQGNQLCSKKKSEHVKVEAYYYINWMDPKSWCFLGHSRNATKKQHQFLVVDFVAVKTWLFLYRATTSIPSSNRHTLKRVPLDQKRAFFCFGEVEVQQKTVQKQ